MKNQRKIIQALSLVTQFTLNMLVPIGMCMAVGVWLDDKYDMPWVIIVLFFVGALAGFTNIFKMAKPFMKSDRNKRCDDDIE
ncbi:MAG: AtpZ/AtpI family protein [Lachnospiraceae bacterium]|nr:AtpZ/AtpI family protein [Lachnospiraceae bacterium]